jgi:hypothetical protein
MKLKQLRGKEGKSKNVTNESMSLRRISSGCQDKDWVLEEPP